MGKSKKMHIYAHFGQFPIILKQNIIFQTILLVITALWALSLVTGTSSVQWHDDLPKRVNPITGYINLWSVESYTDIAAKRTVEMKNNPQTDSCLRNG